MAETPEWHQQLQQLHERMARVASHRTTEDLGFVLGAPERREMTQSETAIMEARMEALQERLEAMEPEQIQQKQGMRY